MLFLACAALPAALRADQQDYIVKSSADLVVVDVSVVGSNGTPVAGLAKDNFVISEDGQRQSIKQFSSNEAPVSIGFVLDMSGSMHDKVEGVRRAANAFLDASNPRDEYFLIGFNDKAWVGLPAGTPFSSSLREVRKALAAIRPEGRTALNDGIVLALKHVETSHYETRVLVLVSDGKDTSSSLRLSDALQFVRSSPVTIYTIGLFEEDDIDKDPALLKNLARMTGGKFFHPVNQDQIEEACAAIAREIRARYTIAYTPPAEARQSVRKIKVELLHAANAPKASVRARTEYSIKKPVDN
jgi:Ca-activated chloride channel family protein